MAAEGGKARTEEGDPAKTTDEKEAQTEEGEAKEESIERTLDFDPFEFDYTGEGIGRPQEDSITNIPGIDQTTNRVSSFFPPIGSPTVVASVQQQLSPRMLTPRPRSQVTLNPAAAPWSPNRIQEPAFVDHNYAFGMPQQHHYPNAAAPVMMYEQHRGQAPMWPVMYNPPQAQIVPYILRGQAPVRPMVHNNQQQQLNQGGQHSGVPNNAAAPMMFQQHQNLVRGQAPVRPMVHNNQQQQLNQGGQHFGFPNNAAAPMMFQQHQNLVRGQAPVRPMVYNQQQLFNQGQHFGFPNNAVADQEMQQLQAQMQQPAESQGSNSVPSSGESQD